MKTWKLELFPITMTKSGEYIIRILSVGGHCILNGNKYRTRHNALKAARNIINNTEMKIPITEFGEDVDLTRQGITNGN